MRMVFGSLKRLDKTDLRIDRTRGAPGAFLGAIEETKFERIHAELFAQLVDRRFHSKRRGRRTRGAVGGGLGPIHHHVIALDPGVGNIIRRHHTLTAGRHWRARVSACLVDQMGFCSDAFAVFGRAQFDPDMRTGSGAGGFEHFRPGHGHFNRAAGFLSQSGSHGLDVHNRFAAKTATDLHRNGFHLRDRHVHEAGGHLAHGKLPLATGPDREAPIAAPVRGRGVGLDIALVHRRR